MRRLALSLILLAAAFLAISPPAHAQGQYVNGSITVADSGTCSTPSAFVLMNLSGGSASVAINVSGTFSATLSFVTTVDTAAHYTAVNAYPPSSTTAVTSTTSAGTWTVSVPGMASLCVYASAYASGTAVVAMRSTAAISASTRGGGGGGGSGTVSGQANGVIPLGTTATSITQQSHLSDNGTTVSSSEPLAVTGALSATAGFSSVADGVHAGLLSLAGNTANPSVAANTFNLFGPTLATFTGYGINAPSAAPVAGTVWCQNSITLLSFCNNLSQNGIGTTPTDGWELSNSTPAGAGAQQYSPAIHFSGQGWKTASTAGSQPVDWRAYVVPLQGTNSPFAYLNFDYSTNNSGYTTFCQMFSLGYLICNGQNQAQSFQSIGSTFTASGCGNSTLAGGATAGQWKSVTAGSCSITITFGSSQAPSTGWSCWANDQTTAADVNNVHMTSNGTSSVVFTEGTVAANDIINFGCLAY